MKSFFELDSTGQMIPEKRNGKRYFKKGEKEYVSERIVFSNKTAFVVMDPWLDSGDESINASMKPIFSEKLLPLVIKSIELGIPVYVLTNDPAKNYADYGSEIHSELSDMAKQGKIEVLYHQNFSTNSFSDFLHQRSIDTIIYSGFASNICVIGREMGMIPMKTKGFRLFFIPEASAAIEFGNSWGSGDIHRATTSLISQSVGELIDFDIFMKLSTHKALIN